MTPRQLSVGGATAAHAFADSVDFAVLRRTQLPDQPAARFMRFSLTTHSAERQENVP